MHLADAAEVRVQQQTAAKSKLSSQISGIPSRRPQITSTGERYMTNMTNISHGCIELSFLFQSGDTHQKKINKINSIGVESKVYKSHRYFTLLSAAASMLILNDLKVEFDFCRLPYTFLTSDVAEATCACLLAQAEEAERLKMPPVVQERMVIEEFGRCLLQIIESANKTKGLYIVLYICISCIIIGSIKCVKSQEESGKCVFFSCCLFY